ncbi:transposase [Streptomyces canus]|uniref:transposase n=1 Tax=Streptomyces canus TaxID=58343 RepID=UPI0033D225F0
MKADATVTFTSQGYSAGKKINRRKRHLFIDALGLPLAVTVMPASTNDLHDRPGRRPQLLPAVRKRPPGMSRVWADGGYGSHPQDWIVQHLGLVLDSVRRSDYVSGFQVLPVRRVVERSLAWFLRSRRLVRDYERRAKTSESVVLWSPISSRVPDGGRQRLSFTDRSATPTTFSECSRLPAYVCFYHRAELNCTYSIVLVRTTCFATQSTHRPSPRSLSEASARRHTRRHGDDPAASALAVTWIDDQDGATYCCECFLATVTRSSHGRPP